MTTKVTITVPASADYCVSVATQNSRGDVQYQSVYCDDELTVYIHSGLRIIHIEEVPLEIYDDYVYEECVHEGE